jgi:hypothetical protein
MSHEIFGVGGGQMYREGWQHEEIRVAIDGPSGAYDDPDQAGDSERLREDAARLFASRRSDAGSLAD